MTADIKKLPRLPKTARASAWYMASNIISRGIAFLSTPVFTRLLSPSEYGIYSLYVSWLGIFTVAETLEIHGVIAYRGLKEFEGESDKFISASLGALSLLSLISFTLYIIFQSFLSDITALSPPLILMLVFQVFLNGAEGLYFAKQRYDCNYKRVAFLNIASGTLSPLLALFLIKRGGLLGEARIIAPLLVSFVFTVLMIVYILRKNIKIYDRKIWKYLFSSAIPMLPHYISLSVMAQGEKIIISHAIGDSALGAYYIAYSAGLVLSPLTLGVSTALTAWISKKSSEKSRHLISSVLSELYGTVSLIFLLFFLIVPEGFKLLASPDYYYAISSVYPIGLGIFYYFISGILYNLIFTHGGKITKNTVASALLGFVFTLAAVRLFGIFGGAVGTLFSYLLLFILNLASSKKVFGIYPIEIQRAVRSSVVLTVGTLLIMLLSGSLLARMILLPAVIMLLLPSLKRSLFIMREN